LERRWKSRLEIQQQESAKKRAAAVATESLHLHGVIPNSQPIKTSKHSFNSSSNSLAQTASWLDRANSILSNSQYRKEEFTSKSTHDDSVKKEMEEVQRLIHEGPIIKKASAGLIMTSNNLSSQSLPTAKAISFSPSCKRKVPDNQDDLSTNKSKLCGPKPLSRIHPPSSNVAFAPINSTKTAPPVSLCAPSEGLPSLQEKGCRMTQGTGRPNPSRPTDTCLAGTVEDAETLMGFLSSVRQAAASDETVSK